MPFGVYFVTHTHIYVSTEFVGVLTRGIGQRFVEGMDVPVLERMCVLRVCACGRVLLMSL